MVSLPTSVHSQQRHHRFQTVISFFRSRWLRFLSALLICYVCILYNRRKHPFLSEPHHVITHTDIEYEADSLSGLDNDFLPYKDASKLCGAHNWQPYPYRKTPRKIYDLIMLNNELDWLEIRLETMAPHVNYFVIVESRVTFTKLPKSLTLQENWDRFKPFHDKIIYKVLENPPINANRTWDLEDYQRNAMLLQGLNGTRLTEEQRAKAGDVLIVADVDEIVRPATLVVLRECEIPPRVTLRSSFYYYGFQWEHRGEEWPHPQATIYRGNNTILPADLRNGEGGFRLLWWWDKQDLWHSGWHCSSCFRTVQDMLNKMQSFSHTRLNQEAYRDRGRIVDRISRGQDLWDRPGEIYDRREDNQDVPEYIKRKTRFGYLLDRNGPDAGFTDYDPPQWYQPSQGS